MTKKAPRSELVQLLAEVYERDGPRQPGLTIVPPDKFAAMTTDEIDQWDFDRRHFMHRIAVALAGETS